MAISCGPGAAVEQERPLYEGRLYRPIASPIRARDAERGAGRAARPSRVASRLAHAADVAGHRGSLPWVVDEIGEVPD
jgi:hypothetical protein